MRPRPHLQTFVASLLCISFMGRIQAQDVLPMQFFASPFTLNPALVGKVEGNYRVCAGLPSLGASYRTASFSIDVPLLSNLYDNRDGWGFGVQAKDGRTSNAIMTSRDLSFSTAYSKGLDYRGFHQVSIGFTFTSSRKHLNSEYAIGKTTEEILAAFSMSGSMPKTGEVLDYNYPSYLDVASGFLYSGTTDGRNNFYFGVSGFHVNTPCESYKGNIALTIDPLFVWHGGGSFPLANPNSNVHVSALYTRQGNFRRVIAGGAVSRSFEADYGKGDRRFFLGAWARVDDKAMLLLPYMALEYNGIRLGLSMSMGSAGTVAGTGGQKGMELTLIYIRKNKEFAYKPSPIY